MSYVHPVPALLGQTSLRLVHSGPRAGLTLTTFYPQIHLNLRKFATHRDPLPSSLLTNVLDQKQRSVHREDSVGPFQLGLVQPTFGGGEKPHVKWSELTTRGKVTRTAERTTNLTVILFGAGLSAILIYALTSELFSKNSPTVLYGDACERIKASPHVSKYLQSPLTFHNTAPSLIRPRHRNRHISSQIAVDSYGREHMMLNFYVQGSSDITPPISEDKSYWDMAVDWTQNRVEVLDTITLDELKAWSKERALYFLDGAKRAFKYLSGSPLPPPILLPSPTQTNAEKGKKKEESSPWKFAGLFSGLRGRKSEDVEGSVIPIDAKVWSEGEVHADLIRNDQGFFVFRYLLVDIPNSRNRRSRVFVEQELGVRHDEPVMRWHS